MFNIKFGRFSKKRNSTKQAADSVFTAEFAVTLKDGCSDRNPSFLLRYNPGAFNYNYCKWGPWYYFVDDVIYERNNLIRVECSLDALATWKTAILNTEAYCSYSSISGGTWLPDRRLPVLNDVTVSVSQVLPTWWADGGNYILATVGDNGSVVYRVTLGQLKGMIASVSTRNAALKNAYDALQQPAATIEDVMKNMGGALLESGLMGNGYSNAPSCIRSCHWVPFEVNTAGRQNVHLGSYDTNIGADIISVNPIVGGHSINIPWQYTDWRRAYCEDLYLYLPFVGIVNLNSENLTHTDTIVVNSSYTVSDGQICYLVYAGSEIIGTYGGNCLMQYPVGINQEASIGDLVTTAFQGAENVVSGGLLGAINNPVGTGVKAAKAVWDVANVSMNKNPSCIGGIGGGAGSGLNKHIVCFSVAHGTSCEPEDLAAVMGRPTEKPILLSQSSGFTQTVNGHVAIPANDLISAEIDSIINTGFFIE